MSVPRAVLGASILAAFLLCLPLAGAQGLLVIHSPANMTYNTTQVGLNWSSGEELDWAWYSLNGAGNASLMLLQNRFNGSAAEKNLTFASAGSQLVYIDLPKNLTSVVSAVANLTGYQSEGSDDYLDVSSDQDSDIKSLWPDSNWDDETDGDGSCSGCNLGLNRNSSQGSNNQALVKFDVSGFSGAFSSARLYLHRTSNNGFIEVYNTSDAWSEGAVTWNNAPAFGALLASGYVGDSGWESFAGSELSDYVSYELASGNQLASFRLNTSYEGDYTIVFSDHESGSAPYIRLYGKSYPTNVSVDTAGMPDWALPGELASASLITNQTDEETSAACDSGVQDPAYAYDEDWTTMAYVSDSGGNCYDGAERAVYENWTVGPATGTIDWSGKVHVSTNYCYSWVKVYFWNSAKSDWDLKYTDEHSSSDAGSYTTWPNISVSATDYRDSDSLFRTKVLMHAHGDIAVGGSTVGYYESSLTFYEHFDNPPQKADLSTTAINNWLSTCSPDANGHCQLPLNISSDSAGIVELSGLEIKYTTNTTITAQEGQNSLTVWANDTLGNLNSTAVHFTVELACSDSTPYGSCSSAKPLYCDNGTLVSKCSSCGCPDGKSCSGGETCQDSGNGNGGGGGGYNPPCEENWTCTGWGACLNRTQARNCTDLNSCTTSVNKSAEVQNCTVPEQANQTGPEAPEEPAQVCEPGTVECFGDELKGCNRTEWVLIQACEHGCLEKSCTPGVPEEPGPGLTGMVTALPVDTALLGVIAMVIAISCIYYLVSRPRYY